MLVLKFGGSVLADAADFRRAAGIVAAAGEPGETRVVVVSATRGTTDRLLAGALRDTLSRHEEILAAFGAAAGGLPLPELEDPDGVELAALGERLAQTVLVAACRERGLEPRAVDPFELGLVTDSEPRSARPVADWRERVRAALADCRGLLVVPGFFGRDLALRRRLLGRNSSDYSAALLAVGGGARRLVIVSESAGLMTADPRLDPEARLVPRVGLAALARVTAAGSRLVHPALPALLEGSGVELLLRGPAAAGGTEVVTRRGFENEDEGQVLVLGDGPAGAASLAVVGMRRLPTALERQRRALRLLGAAGIAATLDDEREESPRLLLDRRDVAAACALLHRGLLERVL